MFHILTRKCTEHEQQQLKQTQQQQDHHINLNQQNHQRKQQQQNDEMKLSNIGDGTGGSNAGTDTGAGTSPITPVCGPSSPDGNDNNNNNSNNKKNKKLTVHLQEQRKIRIQRYQQEQERIQQEWERNQQEWERTRPERERHEQKRQERKQQERINMYQPRIDRYTCVGKYLAYTDRTGDLYFGNINLADVFLSKEQALLLIRHKKFKSRHDDSLCNGYMSKIKTLQSFNQMTRADAIKQFINKYEGVNDSNNIDNSSSDKDYDKGTPYELTEAIESDVFIFSAPSKRTFDTIDLNVKEEELISKRSLVCYGSTDVDCLIIKNVKTGIESIAAVVPKTTGYSKCIVSKIPYRSSKNVFGFGKFSFNFIKTERDTISVKEKFDTMLSHYALEREYRKLQANKNKGVTTPKEKVTVTDIIQESIKFTKLVQANAYTIISNTKMNVQWLVSIVVQDYFLNRVYTSTTKIVYNIPTIISITTNYWFKILSKNDDNNNNNNNNDDSNNTGGGSNSGGSNSPRRR